MNKETQESQLLMYLGLCLAVVVCLWAVALFAQGQVPQTPVDGSVVQQNASMEILLNAPEGASEGALGEAGFIVPDLPEEVQPEAVADIPLFAPLSKEKAHKETGDVVVIGRKKPILSPAKPKIVIVIDDMGLNKSLSRKVSALPGPLTLSFLPYGQGLEAQTLDSAAMGHEIFMHLPMEPFDSNKDPGPEALHVKMSADNILQQVRQNITKFPVLAGVNNHMGSRFTSDESKMKLVLGVLKHHNLAFVDSKTAPTSVAADLAAELRLNHLSRDIFIDHLVEKTAISHQLAKIEAIARRKGYALAIGHPKKETLSALQEWLPTLAGKGFDLVSVTDLIHYQKRINLVARQEY